MAARILSLLALIALWGAAAQFSDPRHLPGPAAVLAAMGKAAVSGELIAAMAITMARVAAAFALAMALGSALGYLMGRSALADRIADPWIVVLLNLPALVIIVLLYIWVGLNEAAAIAAVALNKLPNATVTIREGARRSIPASTRWRARSLSRGSSGCATWSCRSLRPMSPPQPVPACRWCGRLCWWSNCSVAPTASASRSIWPSSCSTCALLLAYALPFTAAMLLIEAFVVQPFERHASRWRPRPA